MVFFKCGVQLVIFRSCNCVSCEPPVDRLNEAPPNEMLITHFKEVSLLSNAVKLNTGAVVLVWLNFVIGEFKVIGPGGVPSLSTVTSNPSVTLDLPTKSETFNVKLKTLFMSDPAKTYETFVVKFWDMEVELTSVPFLNNVTFLTPVIRS